MRNFREYEVWQRAMRLCVQVFELIKKFPADQKFILTSQLQRAAVSLPSNIAEGCSRNTEIDFARFIEIAMGSSFEIETQLLISQQLDLVTDEELHTIIKELHLLQKQLNSLRTKLRHQKPKPKANS